MVTTPNYVKSKLDARTKGIDLSQLTMIVYDEADELFIQNGNLSAFYALKKQLETLKVAPQHLLYSATFTEDVTSNIEKFIPELTLYKRQNKQLKLKGVKQFKMEVQEKLKFIFMEQTYIELTLTSAMVFVN